MNNGVFLSYRRADTAGHAGRICDDLERHFAFPVVFRDIDSIRVGSDFIDALEKAIAEARVAIVLIGDTWLSETSADGSFRINNPEDHVHREVVMALEEESITVIPVLVEGASMPDSALLPEPLQELSRLQAIELSDSRWGYDIKRLALVLEEAGINPRIRAQVPRWFFPLAAVVLMFAAAALFWCWQTSSSPGVEEYTGLWYLPNGSFWTIVDRKGQLWVEVTHQESKQVWKHGSGKLNQDEFTVELELVYDKRPFVYINRLKLSQDAQSMSGTVRRSDLDTDSSLVLTRANQ